MKQFSRSLTLVTFALMTLAAHAELGSIDRVTILQGRRTSNVGSSEGCLRSVDNILLGIRSNPANISFIVSGHIEIAPRRVRELKIGLYGKRTGRAPFEISIFNYRMNQWVSMGTFSLPENRLGGHVATATGRLREYFSPLGQYSVRIVGFGVNSISLDRFGFIANP